MSRLRNPTALPSSPALCAALVLAAGLVACATPEEPVAAVLVAPTSLTLHYSEVREIELTFSIHSPLGEGVAPRVFVHLFEEPVEVLRTFDYPFPGEWRSGESLTHSLRLHQSALGPPLRAGRYRLSVGLYDVDGRRWPLDVDGEEIDDMEYVAAEVVVAESGSLPMFRFSESWEAVEPGPGRQILARRWLAGEGAIGVAEIDDIGSVWMLVQIPAPVEGVSRLVLEPGAEQPTVIVTSACSGSEVELSGAGPHEVELPVGRGDATESGECELSFRPNFHLLENGHGQRRAVLLEALAWSRSAFAAEEEP